jgi:hypothetical protein
MMIGVAQVIGTKPMFRSVFSGLPSQAHEGAAADIRVPEDRTDDRAFDRALHHLVTRLQTAFFADA